VVEVIDGFDLTAMSKSYRGTGSASYHPAPLLGLLVYGYATGVFSILKLERATHDSVALWHYRGERYPNPATYRTFGGGFSQVGPILSDSSGANGRAQDEYPRRNQNSRQCEPSSALSKRRKAGGSGAGKPKWPNC
jgi:hypothetical protein